MNSMRSTSLVLFDLDETLFDHGHASRTALDHLRGRHPALQSAPLDEVEDRAREILDRVHEALLGGRLSIPEARRERLRCLFSSFGETPGDEFLDHTACQYGALYRRARRSISGSRRLLERLRDDRSVRSIAIVTNHMTEIQNEKLAACGLVGLVDFMVTSEEVGHRKPARQIFEAALDRADIRGVDAVMVGDSWDADVLGALSAGVRAVWFNPRGEVRPDASLPASQVGELGSFEPVEQACRVILSA